MPVIKAKREARQLSLKPALARAEILDKATRGRFEVELDAVVKRRSPNEAKLAGALRAVAPMSPVLRGQLGEVVGVMLRRGSRQREIYSAAMRTLAEVEDRSVPGLLKRALEGDEAGGTPALSAACFSRDPALAAHLAKVASSRQSHLAFGAELARVARAESNGAHLAALAPMIKESHRIAMCVELFVPLARGIPVPVYVGPALTVLRGAERHLGRWLVLGDVAVKAGDRTPIDEARSRADVGPVSSRAAWSLVLWALEQTAARASGRGDDVGVPDTRPTLELIARLSDRPSADRDTTFLFRMAHAPVARPMLEALARPLPLGDEVAIRAAMVLARDHGRTDMLDALGEAAGSAKREELRGLAAAALWDAARGPTSDRQRHQERHQERNQEEELERARLRAREHADDLVVSRIIGNVAWGALIRAAARAADERRWSVEPLVTETVFRWIQWGWPE
jgi:hypothetical protein